MNARTVSATNLEQVEMLLRRLYYALKPVIPRRVQLMLRRMWIRRKRRLHADVWPISRSAGNAPEDWTGWPNDKRFSLVLTHDIDTARGQARCRQLAEIEERLGFRSAMYFVPERYPVSPDLREDLASRGFEVGVHGLTHDGKLYKSREIFEQRATRINHYLEEWGCCGFRSPAMHHNLDWLRSLHIAYDASTFDTDPFEPQPDGMDTIFPFQVPDDGVRRGYVELPYTLAQDCTLFVMMQERDIGIWKRKLEWIVQRGGMALLITHPDYMRFDRASACESYPVAYYEELLQHIKDRYADQYWHALPRDMAQFWTERNRLPAAGAVACRVFHEGIVDSRTWDKGEP